MNLQMTHAHSGDLASENLQGDSSNLFIQYKRSYFFNKWFIQSGCAALFWVYRKICVGCLILYFPHPILCVALCVREIREVSTQSILVIIVSVFSLLQRVTWPAAFCSPPSAPTCTSLPFLKGMYLHYLFPVFLLSCPPQWRDLETHHVDSPASCWNRLKSDLFVMSASFTFLLSRKDYVSASVASVFPTLKKKKCCEKAAPNHGYHRSRLF